MNVRREKCTVVTWREESLRISHTVIESMVPNATILITEPFDVMILRLTDNLTMIFVPRGARVSVETV